MARASVPPKRKWPATSWSRAPLIPIIFDMTHARVWQGDTLGEFPTDEEADAAVSLAQAMSDISERCYYAGWEHGTENVLWEALRNGPRSWGVDSIRAEDLSLLKRLSDRCGGWISYSAAGAKFIPLSEWEARKGVTRQ